ncbi:MAG: hypothetical protein COX65_09385 [Elusimicrobia bacterium CG_4_10_14_0_2_um_filter_56_8]|nr:MAG: hypothetical protein AUJ51_07045 [Elusimicrobia bacterium CG1_02_56_21]PJA11920.1 MAG: hypothetical protein COX65_09385 [Elusimicrobia bacterium CG_4_10_14_0_2_um_filter_56_8]
MNKLLLVFLLAFPAYPALAQLSPADKAFIKECEANIDPGKKILSPETADKCVKGLNEGSPEVLLARYSYEDPEAAGILIANNNALLDLKRIVVKQDGFHGARALARVLEKPDCALCDMALGPKPETTFDWVGKYASERAFEVKREVRTWDALGNIRTTSLSSPDYGKDKAAWNEQGIMSRYSELSTWARKETDKLSAAAGLKSAAGKLDIAGLASVLREDLIFSDDAPYRAKLDALAAMAREEAGNKKPEAPSAADKKAKDLAAASDRLASINPDGQGDYLAHTFDNASASRPGALRPGTGSGSKAGPGTGTAIAPVQMTADQEKALGERLIRMEKGKPVGDLAEVMSQTEAGKRTVDFYSDPKYAKAGSNKLDFAFTREPGVFGYWDPDARVIRINSEVAEEFAARRGQTVPQLMEDKAGMKALALYISPTMVHEAEHQNQTARAIAAGTDYKKFSSGSSDPYTRAKENLSNTESAKHMIEYCSKNGGAGCYANFHAMHVDNAEKFMQGGVEALDTLKAPLYARIDSFEGGTAREFKMAQTYAAQVKTLEALQRSNPSGMTAEQQKDLRDYRELMNTRFKWYTMSYQENVVNDASALAFRKKYGTVSSGGSVPTL